MQPSLFTEPAGSPQALTLNRDLNDAQAQAVECLAGPLLVIAGAGSGKTRTLVYRVARLIASGVAPEAILLLTFTRRAAQEMIERAATLLDASCHRITGGTFHAVASLLLRRYGFCLGFGPNFTILDRADAEDLVNVLKSSLNLGGSGRQFPSKRAVLDLFSRAVNRNEALPALVEADAPHLLEHLDALLELQRHYRSFKQEHGLMDFDDLLVHWKTILETEPWVRAEIGTRFSHIMVDEYQDTNRTQAAIVRLMAHGHDNVMVVGDDSQSIYSFRGADFRNILEFPQIFAGTRIIKLEENYRSSQPILAFANAVIAEAREKYTKALYTKKADGTPPCLYAAWDEGDQSRFVVSRIRQRLEAGVSLREIAVLFRSGYHSFNLELELGGAGIPFEKRGGLKLTEGAHIKDLVVHLRLVTNERDFLSWNRALLLLDKVGPRTAQAIVGRMRAAESPLAALTSYEASPAVRPGLTRLAELVADLAAPGRSPSDQFQRLFDYYRPLFERIFHDDFPKRRRDLDQLGILIAGYTSLQAFLDDLALDPIEAGGRSTGAGDRLVLSTVHSAKGLEWDTVFVINLVEGGFPSGQALAEEDLEEERRLFYVAVTRAREQLVLCYPRTMMTADRQLRPAALSPFLRRLPGHLLATAGPGSGSGRAAAAVSSLSARPGQAKRAAGLPPLAPGMTVQHALFGQGQVVATSGPRTVEVFFSRYGKKTLHLDYAPLTLVSPG
ncbi:MAG: ATP-dependent helicase [Thermodesulfobacteriota bacterium]